jgi:nicotinamide mononucleotide adenylyltransferase
MHTSPESVPEAVDRIGMIARWKPVHIGHSAILEALVARARHALIGIGSSNEYNAANPFTAAESGEMIRLCLRGNENYSLVEVPDLHDGPRWRCLVLELFGELDLFVTANGYVRSLLQRDYRIVHPVKLIPPERQVAVDGTMVRRLMARGEEWRSLVPDVVSQFIDRNGLADRFRREFGLETIALDAPAHST